MARPSKTKSFAIYQDSDTGMPTPPHDVAEEPFAEYTTEQELDSVNEGRVSEGQVEEGEERSILSINAFDNDRRESTLTSASISSLPESSFETDYDDGQHGIRPQPSFTPPIIRPSFMRPESVRRMQMSSPTPSVKSLRRSVLSPPRARTPRSNRSSVRVTPRSRPRYDEEDEESPEEKREFPLVLLHVTLLPVELRWSHAAMQELLPSEVLEQLQTLRSKVSDTIAQRGILIPHPREEYELMEERLLEALELKKPRITKCGHFQRDSTSSTSSADSGLGGSGFVSEECGTCHHPLKTTDTFATSTGGRKWSVRVFAANGLMRAGAWAAAWSEMERVDVEVLPWIEDDVRRGLDERMALEAEEEAARHESMARTRFLEEAPEMFADTIRTSYPTESVPPFSPVQQQRRRQTVNEDLPRIYQPKDIPLSLLLKNYIYLLAQDKRNIVIFALGALAFWLSLRAAVGSPNSDDVAFGHGHGHGHARGQSEVVPSYSVVNHPVVGMELVPAVEEKSAIPREEMKDSRLRREDRVWDLDSATSFDIYYSANEASVGRMFGQASQQCKT